MFNGKFIFLASTSAVIGFGAAVMFASYTGSIVAKPVVATNTAGEKIFLDRCSSCHAIDARAANGFGPNIANIGNVAATRKTGLNAAEFILESIVEPQAYREPGVSGYMPRGIVSGLPPERVRDLISYVASIGDDVVADPDDVANLVIDPRSLEVEHRRGASLELLRRGENLFFKQLGCSSCHSIYGEPGSSIAAPSLAHSSRLSPGYIAESIRKPSAVITAGYRQISIETNTGERIDGRLVGESVDSVSVLSHVPGDQPLLQQIPRSTIVDSSESPISRMPAYDLSTPDEEALVAFLGFLEAETTEP